MLLRLAVENIADQGLTIPRARVASRRQGVREKRCKQGAGLLIEGFQVGQCAFPGRRRSARFANQKLDDFPKGFVTQFADFEGLIVTRRLDGMAVAAGSLEGRPPRPFRLALQEQEPDREQQILPPFMQGKDQFF